MLVHTVYFWLKPEHQNEADLKRFREGVQTLATITSAMQVHVGTPAATTKRPVVDDSYDVALLVLLKDIAQHDAYQADPIHQAFIKEFVPMTQRVTVYDAD